MSSIRSSWICCLTQALWGAAGGNPTQWAPPPPRVPPEPTPVPLAAELGLSLDVGRQQVQGGLRGKLGVRGHRACRASHRPTTWGLWHSPAPSGSAGSRSTAAPGDGPGHPPCGSGPGAGAWPRHAGLGSELGLLKRRGTHLRLQPWALTGPGGPQGAGGVSASASGGGGRVGGSREQL